MRAGIRTLSRSRQIVVNCRRCRFVSTEAARPRKLHADAESILRHSLRAADPRGAIRRALQLRRDNGTLEVAGRAHDLSEYDRILVLGGGKAAAHMAEAVEDALAFAGLPIEGLVVTKYDHAADTRLQHVVAREAAHPVPDSAAVEGVASMLELADAADARTLTLALISGGGSSLLTHPSPGLALQDVQEMNSALLACGATINQMNTLRKHVSAVGGGQLARRLAPSTVLSLVLSDVIGDPLDVIASGPTVPDAPMSTFQRCEQLMEELNISCSLPPAIVKHFRDGVTGQVAETPKEVDDVDWWRQHTQTVVVGSNTDAVEMARARAVELGYKTIVLSTSVEGEAREVAKVYSAVAREMLKSGQPALPPACIIAGGETTVTIRGEGKGGRNQELALAAALEIQDLGDNAVVLSAGTDGTDGPTDAAGAAVDGGTIARAAACGLDAKKYLSENDAYNFFQKLGDGLLMTGPTGTNVMDIALVLVEPSRS